MLRFVALSAIIASASATGSYAVTGPAISSYSTGIVHSAYAPKVAIAGPAAVGFASAPAAVGFASAPAAVGFATAPAAVAAVAPVAAVAASHAVIPGAVLSNHIVKHYDVPSSGAIVPTTIDVPANVLPVNFVFRSASSAINVQQAHQGSAGSFKETASQDEPHVLKHTVTKPIIQEVREIISPFRKITQTVEPVREEIQTLVARGVGATQGALLAANMAAKPALMAAAAPVGLAAPVGIAGSVGIGGAVGLAGPVGYAGPVGIAGPGIATRAIAAGPAIATMAAPAVAAVARPAVAVGSFGPGLATAYDAGYGSAVAVNTGLMGAKVAGFAAPAISTFAAKKL